MREIIEFRIPEENAQRFLSPSVGVMLGDSIRKVEVATDDPLCARIYELDQQFRRSLSDEVAFFFGWRFHRRYTQSELDAAELFCVKIKRSFEPTGEECGTIYDETTACRFCGVGATQRSELVLRGASLAKKAKLAIARTIAGEIIVSDEFVELIESKSQTGARFRPVRVMGTRRPTPAGWRQLFETRHELRIVSPTTAGNSPTDDDSAGDYRCPRGHTIGLNLISELWVSRSDFEKHRPDVAFTRQRIGARRGLLRPNPALLVSASVRETILKAGLRGFDFEVAHLSSESKMPDRPANALVEREAAQIEEIMNDLFSKHSRRSDGPTRRPRSRRRKPE